MSYSDDLVKLRKRLLDAVSTGIVDDSQKDFLETSLIQMMNDAEKNRQTCMNTADNLKRQAAIAEGQAQAFASMSSIIFNVMNGLVAQAEKNKIDELRRAEELKEIKEFENKSQETNSVKETKSKKKS